MFVNTEKMILAASAVCVVIMLAVVSTRGALTLGTYETSKMFVNRSRIVGCENIPAVYRRVAHSSPFKPKSAATIIDVKIDLPDMPSAAPVFPPLFWKKEATR